MGAQHITLAVVRLKLLGGEGWPLPKMGCKEFSRSRRAACHASPMVATQEELIMYIASIQRSNDDVLSIIILLLYDLSEFETTVALNDARAMPHGRWWICLPHLF
jgi:hypothetical protein